MNQLADNLPGPMAGLRRVGPALTCGLALAYLLWMLVASWNCVGQTFPGFVVSRSGIVSPFSRAHWSGLERGLRVHDRIVAVDGWRVTHGQEIFRAVAAARPGAVFAFSYERSGVIGRQTAHVPSAVFSREDWLAVALPPWLLGAAHLMIGILVLLVARRDVAARAHFLFCLASGITFAGAFNGNTNYDLQSLPVVVGAALLAFASLNLALVLPRRHPWLGAHPRWPRVLGGIALVWVLGIVYVTRAFGSMPIVHVFFVVPIVMGQLALVASSVWARWSRTSTPREHAQAGVILLGVVFGLLTAMMTYVLRLANVHVWGVEYVSLSGVLFPAAIAYSIVRHELFAIELIVKRTVMYMVVTATLVSGYFLLIAATRALVGGHSEASNVLATTVIALCFAPLRDLTKRYVDRAFFRTTYAFERLVTDFGREAREVNDPLTLCKALFDQLEGALQPAMMAVLTQAEGSDEFIAIATRGHVTAPGRSLADLQAQAPDALSFPLVCNDQIIGCVLVGSSKSERAYGEPDRLLLVNLVQIASGVLGNLQMAAELARRSTELTRLGQEMAIATAIQTALVPNAPSLAGFDVALEQVAASEVGGDLVDYVANPDGRFWLAMGDVTGHGLTPGLVMMMAQSMFTSLATHTPDHSPRELLARLNRTLFQSVQNRLKHDTCMTLQLVHHDGEGRFSAAGLHCDILIFRALTGVVERVETSGMWVGLMPEIGEFTSDCHFELAPGDIMLLYTDGLLEARNAGREQFDVQRLEQALVRHAGLDADAIKQRIMAEVRAWLHLQDDDLTLLVLKRQLVGTRLIPGLVASGLV